MASFLKNVIGFCVTKAYNYMGLISWCRWNYYSICEERELWGLISDSPLWFPAQLHKLFPWPPHVRLLALVKACPASIRRGWIRADKKDHGSQCDMEVHEHKITSASLGLIRSRIDHPDMGGIDPLCANTTNMLLGRHSAFSVCETKIIWMPAWNPTIVLNTN